MSLYKFLESLYWNSIHFSYHPDTFVHWQSTWKIHLRCVLCNQYATSCTFFSSISSSYSPFLFLNSFICVPVSSVICSNLESGQPVLPHYVGVAAHFSIRSPFDSPPQHQPHKSRLRLPKPFSLSAPILIYFYFFIQFSTGCKLIAPETCVLLYLFHHTRNEFQSYLALSTCVYRFCCVHICGVNIIYNLFFYCSRILEYMLLCSDKLRFINVISVLFFDQSSMV